MAPSVTIRTSLRLVYFVLSSQAKGSETPAEVDALKKDPRAPAMMHGNQPSRGAEVDAELQAEEEEQLKKGRI